MRKLMETLDSIEEVSESKMSDLHQTIIEALEAAKYAIENPDSDQDFAVYAINDVLSMLDADKDGYAASSTYGERQNR